MKRVFDASVMYFYGRMQRITWLERVSNDEVLWIMRMNSKLVLRTNKRELRFMGHLIRKLH